MQMIGTTEGSSDRLFAECAAWRSVQRAVTDLFRSRGYSELMTPETEYYDLFVAAGSPLPQESMMKVIDRSGRILVLRPDNTTPIARLTAAKLRSQPLPQRLFYNQNVYRSDHANSGRSAEVPQCGVELIGAAGVRADLELICLAIGSIEAAGVSDFRLELGCVDYFAALTEQLAAPQETVSALRLCVEEKNFTRYAELLQPYADTDAGQALLLISRQFGGMEILDAARQLPLPLKARGALDYLQQLAQTLTAAGLGERISFDLGLVQRLDYYTGVVFRGYARGSGSVVLSGGRYDRLIGRLGYDVPAIGFAVDVAALSQCLPQELPVNRQVLIYYQEGFLHAALHCLARQTAGTAMLSVSTSEQQALLEARRLGIQTLLVVGPDGERSIAL